MDDSAGAAKPAVMQAYFDESGIHAEAEWLVVAGFVGLASEWEPFEREWKEATDGVTFHSIKFFSRTQSGARKDQYSSWNDDRASAYLGGVLSALEHSSLQPVVVQINVEAFKALPLLAREFLTGVAYERIAGRDDAHYRAIGHGAPATPWHMGFGDCVATAASLVADTVPTIDYVFDLQNDYADYAHESFDRTAVRLPEPWRSKRGTLAFVKKDGIAGLQVADLLAYVCQKKMRETPIRRPELTEADSRVSRVIVQRGVRRGSVRSWDAQEMTKQFESGLPEDFRKHVGLA